jgi:hypothetical protein
LFGCSFFYDHYFNILTGWNERGRQVQEQCSHHFAEKEAPVPHPVGKVS